MIPGIIHDDDDYDRDLAWLDLAWKLTSRRNALVICQQRSAAQANKCQASLQFKFKFVTISNRKSNVDECCAGTVQTQTNARVSDHRRPLAH